MIRNLIMAAFSGAASSAQKAWNFLFGNAGGHWAKNSVVYIGDTAYILVSDNNITKLVSTKNGITFNYVSTVSSDTSFSCLGMAYGNGIWVVVGTSGKVYVSTDMYNWSLVPISGITGNINCVAYVNDRFMFGINNKCCTSTDGFNWTQTAITPAQFTGIAYGLGKYVACTGTVDVYSSTNDTTWTKAATLIKLAWSIKFGGNNRFVLGGTGQSAWVSSDGVGFGIVRNNNEAGIATNVEFRNGTWITSGNGVRFNYTFDPGGDNASWQTGYAPNALNIAWGWINGIWFSGTTHMTSNLNNFFTRYTQTSSQTLYCIRYINGKFVAAGNNGAILTSVDGENWTFVGSFSGTTNYVRDIVFFNGYYYLVFDTNVANTTGIRRSNDLITWHQVYPGIGKNIWGIHLVDGVLYCTGASRSIQSSTDGVNWWTRYDPGNGNTLVWMQKVSWLNKIIATGSGYWNHSTDGLTWSVTAHVNGPYCDKFVDTGTKLIAGHNVNGGIYATTDGVNWTLVKDTASEAIGTIEIFNGTIYAFGKSGTVFASSDNGVTWSISHQNTRQSFYRSAKSADKLIAIGADTTYNTITGVIL